MSNYIHLRDKGFTLVELAIALMVIGLLIGGVLKGQELIENAKITATIRQIKAYDAATMIFKNTYGALPGDIKKPQRVPNCTLASCLTAGNGDGRIAARIYSGGSDSEYEAYNFFVHLSKAGMIQGPEGDETPLEAEFNDEKEPFFPALPIDTSNYIRAVHLGPHSDNPYATYSVHGNNYWLVTTGSTASTLDQKMDDGKPVYGDMRSRECAPDPETYDITQEECPVYMRTGF